MNGMFKMIDWLTVQVIKAILALVGAGVTTLVANEVFNANWSFWPALVVWLLLVFFGILILEYLDD